MAKGFKYFPCSTSRYEDPRVMRLVLASRYMGMAVYDYIVASIYRDGTGGVLIWDESRVLDAATYFGLKESQVCEIVTQCGVVGLFDCTLLSRGVLTSADVQHQYAEMCRKAKRQVPIIPEEYRLISQENPPKKVREELPKLTEVLPKVREVPQKTPKKLDKVFKNIHTSYDDVYINTATAVRNVGEWIDVCLSEVLWTNAIRMNHHLSMEELSSLLHTFTNSCICRGKTSDTLKGFKDHFSNWLFKQPKSSSSSPRADYIALPTPLQEEEGRKTAEQALRIFNELNSQP